MTLPNSLPAITFDQNYVSTIISAFGDNISASTVPPTCLARNCMSDSPNVIWDTYNQHFTVQTLGVSDVLGTSTVTLTCSLTSLTAVTPVS
jgi:hypothetical protein